MEAVTLVIMTRNRVDELLRTLGELTALPEQPAIIVADNGSSDGTSEAVAERFPDVELIRFEDNVGVEARNIAASAATTSYIAFNDDDSWWAPGSLGRVAELFDQHPTLGAATAHIVVEPGGRADPMSLEMRDSPVRGDPDVPGIPVLGFLACATAVRRSAFLEVGGFATRLHFAGEEQLLAVDLVSRGWQVRMFPELRVHHHASRQRDPRWRQRREIRNTLWYLWLRRPVRVALHRSWRLVRAARPGVAWGGLLDAVKGGRWVIRERAVVPGEVEAELHRLESHQDHSIARQVAS